MIFDDDDDMDAGPHVVRAFMITNGRTRALAQEYPIETIVTATSMGDAIASQLRYERRSILRQLAEPSAIAELAARLKLPLRAVQVLVSDMIADGNLQCHEPVKQIDTSLLLNIRAAITAL